MESGGSRVVVEWQWLWRQRCWRWSGSRCDTRTHVVMCCARAVELLFIGVGGGAGMCSARAVELVSDWSEEGDVRDFSGVVIKEDTSQATLCSCCYRHWH